LAVLNRDIVVKLKKISMHFRLYEVGNMYKYTIISLFLATIFLAGKPAFPQAGNEASEKAKELFSAAVEHFKDGKYEDALKEFDETYKLNPHWKIRFNIGICHYQLKNYVRAAEELTKFIEEGGTYIPEKQQTMAGEILSELKKRLGILKLSGEIENSIVTVDGKVRHGLTKDEAIYLQPGKHNVVVKYKGSIILDEELTIDAGTSREIHAKVLKAAEEKEGKGPAKLTGTPAEKEKLPAESAGEKTRAAVLKSNIAYGMAAGAAVTIIAGSVLGGLVFKEKNEVEDAEGKYNDPETPPEDRPGLLKDRDEHYDRGMQYATAANVLIPLGGAMAVTSIVLMVISIKEKKPAAGGKKSAFSVAPGSFLFLYRF
jgi:hypothetical protein